MKTLRDLLDLGDIIIEAEVVAGTTDGWTIPTVRVNRKNSIMTFQGKPTIGVDNAISVINMGGTSIGMKPGTFQIRVNLTVPFNCRG